MTSEVFNEPWHYFGARGEGAGGWGEEVRGVEEVGVKGGEGMRTLRCNSGSNKGGDSEQMSHCH